jgi:uncharacterized metal-binding protein YceD (DUF177 family)
VKELTKYDIDIYGLPQKQHVYDFESGDAFFEEMHQEIISHGHFRTTLVLDKSATLIQLNFRIEGTVELTCDRTLELFDEGIDIERRLILKMGDRDEELGGDIEVINRNTQRINVAQYIYEFIVLSLPVKKLHPDQRKENENEFEALVYSSSSDKKEENPQAPQESVDPRWDQLKKLKRD